MTTGSDPLATEFDLSDISDSRAVAIGMVPANSRVLDLGLGSTSVARILAQMGCRVWGVGTDPEAVEAARVHCEMVFEEVLDTSNIVAVIGEQRFDVILLLDVLEYRRDPAGLLRSLPGLLTEHGWGVISLSNHADTSLPPSLPDGSGRPRAEPLVFDRQGIDDLLGESGWDRFDLVRMTRCVDGSEPRNGGGHPGPQGGSGSDLDGLIERFVVAAAPLGSPVLDRPPLLPWTVAQRCLSEATTRINELNTEVARLQRHVLPDVMDELDAIRPSASKRKTKLEDFLVAIGQLEARSRELYERLAQLDGALRETSRELRASKADVTVKDEFVVALEAELEETLTHLRAKTAYIEALPWVRMRNRMKNLRRRPS